MRYKDNGWISSLFVQPKDTLKEIWEGRRPGVEGATADFAVHEAYNNDELETKLQEWLTDARRVFHRGGIHAGLDRLVEVAVRRRDRARQHFGTGPVAVEDPSGHLAELRLRKSSSEIEQMVFASKVASIAHELAMRHSRSGVWSINSNPSSRASSPMPVLQVGLTLPSLAAAKTPPSFTTRPIRMCAEMMK